jgi:hypothetical protein
MITRVRHLLCRRVTNRVEMAMDDFSDLTPATRSGDDARLFAASKKQPEGEADSFTALRRLYMQMGFLLHDHGIETLQQLDSLLKSTALKDVSPGAGNKPSTAPQRLEDRRPTEAKPPSEI